MRNEIEEVRGLKKELIGIINKVIEGWLYCDGIWLVLNDINIIKENNSMIISRPISKHLEILTLAVILFGRKNVLLMAFMATLV